LCDGAAVSRTTYSALWDVLRNGGSTSPYGNGDGSTTFNLPNLKGRVPVGLDSSQTEFDTLGETGGEKTVTLTAAQMPVHNHTSLILGSGEGSTGIPVTASANTNTTTGNAGSGEAHPNLQPYIVVNYIIKY
jgi:microcystin-dependent protein